MSKPIDQEREALTSEVLGRYLRDLRLRTFPDNDEGDYDLRWTAGEIKRVEKAIAASRAAVQPGGVAVPSCEMCHGTRRVKEPGCDEGDCTRCLTAAPNPVSGEPFQARVLPWLLDCFGQAIADDKTERNHRFLEEALELVQSCGCTEDEAHKLVSYVYGRAVGGRSQEVGGVMVTLSALCLAQRLDMHQCGETELARITQPAMVEKIREKQKRKPAMSPLPGSYGDREQFAEPPAAQDVAGLGYQALFNAIAAATRVSSEKHVAISVEAFQQSIAAHGAQQGEQS